jgi:flagellar biosynthesis chaperone FliJ
MKKFAFRLERVREWREKQLAMEEARLEQLYSEKVLVEQSLALLEREGRDSAAIVKRKTALEAFELQAADVFSRYVIAQRAVFAGKLAGCDRRIAEQRQRLIEARRKFELLGKLKDKQWKTWNAELAREIEIQAGEIYLAKWGAEP